MAEIYVSLTQLLSEFRENGALPPALIDIRLDFINYGEILGRVNRADGDRWDIFAPGIPYKLRVDQYYVIEDILGVVFLPNGNHKVVVQLQDHTPEESLLEEDIKYLWSRYINVYRQNAKYKRFVFISPKI